MSIRCTRRSGPPLWSALALFSFSVGLVPFAHAEPPPESLALRFDTGAPIVLPTEFAEKFTRCEDAGVVDGQEVGLVCAEVTSRLVLATDSRGKITGSGGLDFVFRGDNLPVLLTSNVSVVSATGSIRRSGSRDAALNLKVSLEGTFIATDAATGQERERGPVRSTAVFKGAVSGNGQFVGTLKFTLKDHSGSFKLLLPGDQQLPGDFGWQLALSHVTTDAKGRVSGLAQVTLAGDPLKPLEFSLTGKYNAKRDESALKLKPLADPDARAATRGTSLSLGKLKTEGDGVTSGEVSYKLAGQSGKKLPLAPQEP